VEALGGFVDRDYIEFVSSANGVACIAKQDMLTRDQMKPMMQVPSEAILGITSPRLRKETKAAVQACCAKEESEKDCPTFIQVPRIEILSAF
jgi:hypothetical protein